jgi:hypothetical protein
MTAPASRVQKGVVIGAHEVAQLQPIASEIPSEHPVIENSLQTGLVFVCECESRFQNSVALSQSEKSFQSS